MDKPQAAKGRGKGDGDERILVAVHEVVWAEVKILLPKKRGKTPLVHPEKNCKLRICPPSTLLYSKSVCARSKPPTSASYRWPGNPGMTPRLRYNSRMTWTGSWSKPCHHHRLKMESLHDFFEVVMAIEGQRLRTDGYRHFFAAILMKMKARYSSGLWETENIFDSSYFNYFLSLII
jgi:hypothetical protein